MLMTQASLSESHLLYMGTSMHCTIMVGFWMVLLAAGHICRLAHVCRLYIIMIIVLHVISPLSPFAHSLQSCQYCCICFDHCSDEHSCSMCGWYVGL